MTAATTPGTPVGATAVPSGVTVGLGPRGVPIAERCWRKAASSVRTSASDGGRNGVDGAAPVGPADSTAGGGASPGATAITTFGWGRSGGRVGGLVARHPVAHIEPLDQLERREQFERAVDARAADGAAAGAEAVVDLLRGERAALARQQLDHRLAGAAVLVARRLQRRARMVEP